MLGSVLSRERVCLACRQTFSYGPGQNNRRYCSADCSREGARASRRKFHKLNPNKISQYRTAWLFKVGPDNNMLRFRLRFPDAPTACESCGESRVLDIAHKPGHERRGAWRSKKNTTRESVWILCPTCHALIDRKGYDPKGLGLL